MSSFWAGSGRPIAIAHRGGAGSNGKERFSQENTVETFKNAQKAGILYLEVDVMLTGDGNVVILHVTADKLEKLLFKKDAPNAQSVQKLSHLQLKNRLNREIPTLEDVFKTFPRARFLIDAKTNEVVEPLAKVIIAAKAQDRVLVNSFYKDRVARLQILLGPDVASGLIISRYPRLLNRELHALRAGRRTGYSAIVLPLKYANKKTIDVIHAQGMKALLWTANSANTIESAIRAGADGIMSDDIKLLKDKLL